MSARLHSTVKACPMSIPPPTPLQPLLPLCLPSLRSWRYSCSPSKFLPRPLAMVPYCAYKLPSCHRRSAALTHDHAQVVAPTGRQNERD